MPVTLTRRGYARLLGLLMAGGPALRRTGHPTDQGARRRSVSRYTACSEYRIVLATMPLPANPIDTRTGSSRPGTVTEAKRTL